MVKTADIFIKRVGGSLYDIFEPVNSSDPDSGSDMVYYTETPTTQILAHIQPTGSQGSVKGIQLKNTSSGDEVYAECFMYHSVPVKEKSRLEFDGFKYEIRSTEQWKSSFIKYYKSYLVKVDGQNAN